MLLLTNSAISAYRPNKSSAYSKKNLQANCKTRKQHDDTCSMLGADLNQMRACLSRLSSCEHLIWHLEHCFALWRLVRLKCQFTRPWKLLGNVRKLSVFYHRDGLFTKLIRQPICLSRYQTSSKQRSKMADETLDSKVVCTARQLPLQLQHERWLFLAAKVL